MLYTVLRNLRDNPRVHSSNLNSMSKTLEQLQRQIAELQDEAERLRKKEVAQVIERIKVAIKHYGFTAADLGLARSRRVALAKSHAGKSSVKGTTAKRPVPVKYRDEAGNTWTGRGNRPRWLAAAVAQGAKLEDFAV